MKKWNFKIKRQGTKLCYENTCTKINILKYMFWKRIISQPEDRKSTWFLKEPFSEVVTHTFVSLDRKIQVYRQEGPWEHVAECVSLRALPEHRTPELIMSYQLYWGAREYRQGRTSAFISNASQLAPGNRGP